MKTLILSLTDFDRFTNHVKAYFLLRKARAMMRNAEVEEKRMREAASNIKYYHTQVVLLNAEALQLKR